MFREGGARDEPVLRGIMRAVPLPGAVSIAYAREPDFFAALEVEGRDPVVAFGECDGEPLGLGVHTVRDLWVNGAPREIGYFSSLRALPAMRGSLGLYRGYRWWRERPDVTGRVPFSISTIVEENAAARDLLTAGRRGMPRYREIGRLVTLAVPTLRRRPARCGVSLLRGDQVGAAAVAAFLAATGARRQLFPVWRAQDLERPEGALRGLAPADILVAERRGAIAGTVGLWDQSAFRQTVVAGYSAGMRAVRAASRVLAPLLGAAALPAPGERLRSLYAALVAVRDDDPALFRSLAEAALAEARRRGAHWVLFGFVATDPLLDSVRHHLHVAYRSRIYAVWWPDLQPGPDLDGPPAYLEPGSL